MLTKFQKWFYNSPIPRSLFKAYVGLWTTVTSRFPIGENVYDHDWDTLILLDTCRIDALREVGSEYDFIKEVEGMTSIGSTSNEWMANTFRTSYSSEIAKTVYVSANGYSGRVFEDRLYPEVHIGEKSQPPSWPKDNICYPGDFLDLDQVWRYAPQDSPGHTLPKYVVDRSVAHARNTNPDRLIIHFNQPHAPYIANALQHDRPLHDFEESPFEALRAGVEKEKVWEAYLDNLRFVLDEVKVLLNNIDSEKVVISADHGEAFGEWGMYGHLPGMIHPKVKQVPWVETTASDSGNYEPELEPEQTDRDTETQLKALGYK